MSLNCSFSSHPGEFRKVNEDNAYGFIYQDVLFMIVADGFGVSDESVGKPAGDIVIQSIETYIKKFFRFPGEVSIKLIMEQAIHYANKTILSYKQANPILYANYGCSITLSAITEDNILYTAHVGITRLYLARGGEIFKGTEDDNEATILLKRGELSEEEFLTDPRRDLVVKALGITEDIEFEIQKTHLQVGDLVFLVSDGIYRTLGPQRVLALSLESGELELAVDWLIEGSLKEKCPDNLSVVISYIN